MTEQAGADYERSDIDPAAMGWIAAGLALFVIVVPLAMPLAFPLSFYRASPAAPPTLSADAPALEVDPSELAVRQKQADGQFANSYGWVDRDRKIVRIPMTRAIERLLQTGLPGWPSP